ncbi:MAG: hypothetical protein ACOX7R_09935 [Acetivibrionales bacterium]
MERQIPESLKYFLKNALKDMDDGYEYSSELKRILNSEGCQSALTSKEMQRLRDYADDVKKVGEINYYTEERIREIERDYFGSNGIEGFLGLKTTPSKPRWPF